MNNFLNMDFSQEELNAAQKDEYALIPKGDYTAEITRSEIKDFHWQNSGASGQELSLMFKIIEGEYAGRVIFANPQLSNNKFDSFVSQGRKLLAQIAAACSIKQLSDSTQLHDKPLQIKLGIEVSKNPQYEDKNIVQKVAPLAGGAPRPNFTAQPQVPSAAAPAQDNRPAWERG